MRRVTARQKEEPGRQTRQRYTRHKGATLADDRLPPEEGGAPGGWLLPRANGDPQHHLQPARVAVWPSALWTWLREALHRGVQPVNGEPAPWVTGVNIL